MSQQLIITVSEYIEWYNPAPGMALIEKDIPGERMGRLHMPKGIREISTKYAGTGTIRKLCSQPIYQQEYDQALAKMYTTGQRVAFSNTTPFDVNLPAFCTFENSLGDKTLLVLIHIADILGIVDIPEEKLKGVSNG